jgi:hypothetical protein
MCGGEKILLGKLGRVSHFRCRNCGMMFVHEPRDRLRGTAPRRPIEKLEEPNAEKSFRKLQALAKA